MVDRIFLDYSVQKLTQAAGRVDECLARLTQEQIWAKGSANENAVGNLVLHLCGNIHQWLFSGVGGEPFSRDRDAEFTAGSGGNLRERLSQTVARAVPIIERQTEADLQRRILVQQYEIAVLEAIYHVVEHFAGHAGQIIFATKMMTGSDLGFYKHLKYSAHTERTP